ncbi:MAG TPA: hypothetical protein PLK90_11130 [Clostridiales bacterium]|nr:hypothetical protein [Clostridiales bacterium]HQP70941.1 hypothetical protein [Clostridiales bacterium]
MRNLFILIFFLTAVVLTGQDKKNTNGIIIKDAKPSVTSAEVPEVQVESRESQIKELVGIGINAENENRLDAALKNYYWALVLNSKEKNNENIQLPELKNRNVKAAVPGRIKKILSDIEFKADYITRTDTTTSVIISVTRNGKTVEKLDFQYYEYDSWSDRRSLDYSKAEVILRGQAREMDKLKISVEYAYIDKTETDPYLADCIKNSDMQFRNSDYEIVLKEKIKNNVVEINKDFPAASNTLSTSNKSVKKEKNIKKDKLMYAGAASAILIGIGLAVLLSDDGGSDNPKSANVTFEIPLHP